MINKQAIPQQGNNNFTEVVGDRVLKTPNPNGASFLELTYKQQMERWNKYYADTPYATAFITDDGKLSTPYIEGSGYPNDEQRLAICEAMLKKGCIMVDCRDKRNFVVGKDGEVFPVDFGQVYMEGDRNYKLHLGPVKAEMTATQRKLTNPSSAKLSGIFKSDPELFRNAELYIAALEQYKATLAKDTKNPVAQDKIIHIDKFVADTKERIEKYQGGDKKAFDDYVEANKESIQILAQNRVSRPILYSVILSLLVVPAIYGAIQAAITKGNRYLFITDVKTSEKLALEVQEEVSLKTKGR